MANFKVYVCVCVIFKAIQMEDRWKAEPKELHKFSIISIECRLQQENLNMIRVPTVQHCLAAQTLFHPYYMENTQTQAQAHAHTKFAVK